MTCSDGFEGSPDVPTGPWRRPALLHVPQRSARTLLTAAQGTLLRGGCLAPPGQPSVPQSAAFLQEALVFLIGHQAASRGPHDMGGLIRFCHKPVLRQITLAFGS